MRVNSDFTQVVAIHTDRLDWIKSPMPGVERRMLDRVGEEVARATSIVRYDAGSSFSPHNHDGGEEFIVLDGVFQDEFGDYPAGTYVRNPIGTRHQPRSDNGCTIFVKLWQFIPGDNAQFHLDLASIALVDCAEFKGISRAQLHAFDDELVVLEDWAANAARLIDAPRGVEFLILDGEISFEGQVYTRHGWIRLPPGHQAEIKAGNNGARIWIKSGHLANIRVPGA